MRQWRVWSALAVKSDALGIPSPWSVRHDRSGEFASANLVREEPDPPSNRAGLVRPCWSGGATEWFWRLGSGQISRTLGSHAADRPNGHCDRAPTPAV